jgi:hypothetical protein
MYGKETHELFEEYKHCFVCLRCGGDSNDIERRPIDDDDVVAYGRDAYQDDDGAWYIDIDCCGEIL